MLNLSFDQDNSGIKSVLGAAAMTYVAGLLSSILQLLRLVLILEVVIEISLFKKGFLQC